MSTASFVDLELHSTGAYRVSCSIKLLFIFVNSLLFINYFAVISGRLGNDLIIAKLAMKK